MKKEWSTTKGFLLFEVILASALLALFITTFIEAYLYGQDSAILAGNRAQAVFIAEEGLDAVRNIRDNSFANLADGAFGLSNDGVFTLSDTSDVTGIFTREITISSLDANRKEVTVDVTWQQNPQRTGGVSLKTRLTNWSEIVEEQE